MRLSSPAIRRASLIVFVIATITALAAGFATRLNQAQSGPDSRATGAAAASPQSSGAKPLQISLDRALNVTLPQSAGLKPELLQTADGKQGWVVRIPGGRPIATPAYANGMLFVGGGYGSHEFYAFNAVTGDLVWQAKTSDDGPTAAVVEDGYCAFNTESCTVIVCRPETGKVVWQEWLGDPLMSQPAIWKGRLYIAYPAGGRKHQAQSLAQTNIQKQQQGGVTTSQSSSLSHRLLCADLATGRHLWEAAIPSDVISAPVINDGQCFLTCFDGTSFCLDAISGNVVWKKEGAGTSAPLLAGGQVFMTSKIVGDGGKSYEGLKRMDARRGNDNDEKLLAQSEAQYLDQNKGGGVGLAATDQIKLDSSVGFSSAPQAANLDAANSNVGVNTVAAGWAYQGSRAVYSRGRMLNAQGRFLNCLSAADGSEVWRAEVNGKSLATDSQAFVPPSLGEEYLYLCSVGGHVISVRQKDGQIGFMYRLGYPVVFQPALANGNIYVGTANGYLVCLKTGQKDADGWYAWGGNAQHNKTR